jgi:transposase
MTQLAVNERYCMTLARRTGLPVARFDRSFCYRWPGQTCCVVRSYCATMHKQGANIFESHVAAFKGAPPQPSFG